jgi:general secretion pathway protein A
VLEQLRLLTNLETNTRKLLRIILIGQPELRDILNKPELSQLSQRITSRYHLSPLEMQDISAYIQHRLRVAGRENAELFSDKAIRHAVKLTGGIPRLVNVLCDRALLGAYAENADHVDLRIMKRAGLEVFPANRRKGVTHNLRFIFALILLSFCIGVSAAYFSPEYFSHRINGKPGDNVESSRQDTQTALPAASTTQISPPVEGATGKGHVTPAPDGDVPSN